MISYKLEALRNVVPYTGAGRRLGTTDLQLMDVEQVRVYRVVLRCTSKSYDAYNHVSVNVLS